jgi:Ca2+-binding RTX toxin-like protein
MVTSSDFKIGINAGSTASATVAADGSDINFIITGGTQGDTITAGGGADTIDGAAGADSITGGAGTDSITAGTGADTIVGGAGDDAILLGTDDDSAVDDVRFETTGALNGADTVSNFVVGTGKDRIDFDFGTGSNIAKAALRGDGTDMQIATAAGALDANAGLLVYRADVTAANRETTLEAMTGEAAGDVFYALMTTDTDSAAGTVTLHHVSVAAAGDMTLTLMGTFTFELDEFVLGNTIDFIAA